MNRLLDETLEQLLPEYNHEAEGNADELRHY
jgi:hypothetical protein